MAKRSRSRRKNKKNTQLLLLAAAIVFSLVCWLGEQGKIPGWENIRVVLGMEPQPTPVEVYNAADEIPGNTAIHFIDVGQGDAVLVQQSGHFALIDAGDTDCRESLLDYLSACGVQKLDLVVMTHPHADHIGAMKQVLAAFPTARVLLPDVSKGPTPTSSLFAKVLTEIEEQKIPVSVAAVGDTYSLGEGVFTVVGAGVKTTSLNDISVALRFTSPDGPTLLCTGDGEKEVEADLLQSGQDLSADVFKAAHHGSRTSNTLEFLEAVRPGIVVASCGFENEYGHPHAEVVENFAQVGAAFYETDLSGTVVVSMQAGKLWVKTEKSAD